MPFAQFGVDPETVFKVMDELTIPADQLKAFQENKDGCVIGRKLADDKKLKVGDPLPLEGRCLPGRPEPDGPRDLRRPERPRPADVPVPLRLLRRGVQARRDRLELATAGQRPGLGQRGDDLHQVQERRRHGRRSARRSTTCIATATSRRAPRPRKPSARCSRR